VAVTLDDEVLDLDATVPREPNELEPQGLGGAAIDVPVNLESLPVLPGLRRHRACEPSPHAAVSRRS